LTNSPDLPIRIKWHVVHGKFDDHLTNTFKIIDSQKQKVAPTFVFVDPFGFSHTPFKTISSVLKNAQCEVLVNFMYEEVNRFLSVDKHSDDYDELFGTTEWRKVTSLSDRSTTSSHPRYLSSAAENRRKACSLVRNAQQRE